MILLFRRLWVAVPEEVAATGRAVLLGVALDMAASGGDELAGWASAGRLYEVRFGVGLSGALWIVMLTVRSV